MESTVVARRVRSSLEVERDASRKIACVFQFYVGQLEIGALIYSV
jgi:hypothetical protein